MGIRAQFLDLRRRIDAEFSRNQKRHRRRMRCRPGCTDCCHQLFSIHELEAARVSEAIAMLDTSLRQSIQAAAQRYVALRHTMLQEHGYIEGVGSLPNPTQRLPCPALVDGRCAIYSERPLLCRKVGMPILHPIDARRTAACELNFKPGERVTDPRLVTLQTTINQDWLRLQGDYVKAGWRRDDLPITVADAMLRDFSKPKAETAD